MLSGTASVDEFMPDAATMADFATQACALPGAQVLQLMFETAVSGRQTSLPAGLHPTNPPSMVVQAWHCPESPWGEFSLAMARVQCRSRCAAVPGPLECHAESGQARLVFVA